MTSLVELRSLVRTQTQTDPADLPDATIDAYLQQGFERTINGETRWPFYAQTWELVQDVGATRMTLAGDVSVPGIMTLADQSSGVRLGMVPQEYAESCYSTSTGTTQPLMYSVWGDQVYLWPAVTFAEPRAYILRGYRKPVAWLTPELSPDCDPRLHMSFVHYAAALAYAQQEDEVLEGTYMQRWQQDAELARRAIMEPVHHRPLVGAGSISGRYYPTTQWVIVPPS